MSNISFCLIRLCQSEFQYHESRPHPFSDDSSRELQLKQEVIDREQVNS